MLVSFPLHPSLGKIPNDLKQEGLHENESTARLAKGEEPHMQVAVKPSKFIGSSAEPISPAFVA